MLTNVCMDTDMQVIVQVFARVWVTNSTVAAVCFMRSLHLCMHCVASKYVRTILLLFFLYYACTYMTDVFYVLIVYIYYSIIIYYYR